MAAEVVGGGKDENTPEETFNSNGNLSINLDASSLNESSVTRKNEEIFKLGFNLNDLYKISLQYYRKGEQT